MVLKRRLLAFQQYFSYTCSTCKDFLYECLKFYVWCVLCATIIIYMYYLVSRKEILTLTFSGGETHRPCSLCLKERVFLSTVFLAQIGTLGSQILQHGFLGSGLVWWVSCEDKSTVVKTLSSNNSQSERQHVFKIKKLQYTDWNSTK